MDPVKTTAVTDENGNFDVTVTVGGGPGIKDVSASASAGGGSASANAQVPEKGTPTTTAAPKTTAEPPCCDEGGIKLSIDSSLASGTVILSVYGCSREDSSIIPLPIGVNNVNGVDIDKEISIKVQDSDSIDVSIGSILSTIDNSDGTKTSVLNLTECTDVTITVEAPVPP